MVSTFKFKPYSNFLNILTLLALFLVIPLTNALPNAVKDNDGIGGHAYHATTAAPAATQSTPLPKVNTEPFCKNDTQLQASGNDITKFPYPSHFFLSTVSNPQNSTSDIYVLSSRCELWGFQRWQSAVPWGQNRTLTLVNNINLKQFTTKIWPNGNAGTYQTDITYRNIMYENGGPYMKPSCSDTEQLNCQFVLQG